MSSAPPSQGASERSGIEHAGAKVNLALRVLGKRDDGYHELWTVFDELAWGDELAWERIDRGDAAQAALEFSIRVDTAAELGELAVNGDPGAVEDTQASSAPPDSGEAAGSTEPVPAGDDNLVVRAFRAFERELGPIDFGLRVVLTKRIPAGAGLGGGSSDAAAMLRVLTRLSDRPVDRSLDSIAKGLGADVPFFLKGGRAWADGRGDEIHALPDDPGLHYLLLLPGFACLTADVFRRWHGAFHATNHSLTSAAERVSAAIRPAGREAEDLLRGLVPDGEGFAAGLVNDLDEAASAASPKLAALRERLAGSGLPRFALSGSGSTLFLAAGSAERLLDVHARLSRQLDEWRQAGLLGDAARLVLTRSARSGG